MSSQLRQVCYRINILGCQSGFNGVLNIICDRTLRTAPHDRMALYQFDYYYAPAPEAAALSNDAV